MLFSLQILIGLSVLIIVFTLGMILKYHNHLSNMTGMMMAMSIGMISGLFYGLICGIVLNGQFFKATIISMLLGIFIGVITGSFLSLLAALDGFLSGLMAGMMGAMLGVMIEEPYFTVATKILFLIFVAVISILIYIINDQLNKKGVRGRIIVLQNPITIVLVMLLIFFITMQLDPLYEVQSNKHHHTILSL